MARLVPAGELDLIERVVSEYPEGIGISVLEQALAPHLPKVNRRTLQRRLQRLKQENRIISEGESTALVYKRGPGRGMPGETISAGGGTNGQAVSYIPVSPDGAMIRDLVRLTADAP